MEANPIGGALFLLALLLLWFRPRKVLPISEADKMTGPQFERWCANLLRCSGFRRVKVVGKSNDQGTDIIAYKHFRKYAIQCKRYSHKVGNAAVQQINAGVEYYGAHVAVVMTNNYFTQSAEDAANRCDVVLWDRTDLLRMIQNARRWC